MASSFTIPVAVVPTSSAYKGGILQPIDSKQERQLRVMFNSASPKRPYDIFVAIKGAVTEYDRVVLQRFAESYNQEGWIMVFAQSLLQLVVYRTDTIGKTVTNTDMLQIITEIYTDVRFNHTWLISGSQQFAKPFCLHYTEDTSTISQRIAELQLPRVDVNVLWVNAPDVYAPAFF